jgi:hypothetical protein
VSKLNAEALSRLIELVNSRTMTQKDIGLRFGVSQAMVSKLKLKSERPIPGRRKYVLPIATDRRDVRNAGGFSYLGLGAQIPANNMQLPKQRCEPMNATLTIGSCAMKHTVAQNPPLGSMVEHSKCRDCAIGAANVARMKDLEAGNG